MSQDELIVFTLICLNLPREGRFRISLHLHQVTPEAHTRLEDHFVSGGLLTLQREAPSIGKSGPRRHNVGNFGLFSKLIFKASQRHIYYYRIEF